MVNFRKITEENFDAIIEMKRPESEDFVAPNVYSLAQAWLYRDNGDVFPCAIYDDDTVVGFILLEEDTEDARLNLWRIMLPPENEGKGYGTAAVKLLIRYAKDSGRYKSIDLTCDPKNSIARHIYDKLGFQPTGEICFGEVEMRLELKQLELYIPKLEDLWFYQKMMSDPETMSYNDPWGGCIDYPDEVLPDWHAKWVGQEPDRFYAYIKRCSDGVWIGDVNFHYTPERDWWDMGIVIYAPYRGKGYAVPALRLLLDHAFRVCGVSRLHNDFEATRDAAWAIHRKVGFKEMGMEDGLLQLILTKEDYLNSNP